MPEPLHPPYVPAAVQQFRMLNRWLDVNAQNGPLSRTQTFITLPAFSQTVNWQGYSDIVAAFNYEGPNNFSLKSGSNLPDNPNYCLCIMWKDSNDVVYRYAIWKDVGESIYCPYPLYTGQLIKKNFRFEIWSTNNTPAIQVLPISFYTSVLGNVDYRYGVDSTLVSSDSEVTDFESIKQLNEPTINSTCSLIADCGIVYDQVSNYLTSWTDSVSSLAFTPTGNISYDQAGNVTNIIFPILTFPAMSHIDATTSGTHAGVENHGLWQILARPVSAIARSH